MNRYQLHVREDGRWEWLCTIEAATHAEAFHRAIQCLGDDHYNKPIRLEQDLEGAYFKGYQPHPPEREPR
jgi:hypothetical protein